MRQIYDVTVTIIGGAWDEKEPFTIAIEARTRGEAISEARRRIGGNRTRWDQQSIQYRAKRAEDQNPRRLDD